MENLIEELLTLHATSSMFRQIFESQQTTQLFIDTYKSLVDNVSSSTSSINDWNARILEKSFGGETRAVPSNPSSFAVYLFLFWYK